MNVFVATLLHTRCDDFAAFAEGSAEAITTDYVGVGGIAFERSSFRAVCVQHRTGA